MSLPKSPKNSSPQRPASASPTISVVKEGLLYKLGEIMKTGRQRYFCLMSDGSFIGFTVKPDDPLASEPLLTFKIRDCEVMETDIPKPFAFRLKGLNDKAEFVRTFYTDTDQERQEWLSAIKQLKLALATPPRASTSGSTSQASVVPTEPQPHFSDDNNGVTKRKITFDDFNFLKVLGLGTFGKVFLCEDKIQRKLYALKILSREVTIEKNEIQHTMAECRVLQRTNHPFLLALKCSFQTADKLCFVTEFASGGDLFFHFSRDRYFPEVKAKFYSAEVISAIGYLHKHGIIYRDLKLENILLDHEGHVKLADFGLCKLGLGYGSTTETFCGSKWCFAPEIIEASEYGLAVDWWGVGVVTYEMMVGRVPFYYESADDNDENLYDKILTAEVEFPKSLSMEARGFLTALLTKDPMYRLGGGPEDVKEVMRHRYFDDMCWESLVARQVPPPFVPNLTSNTDTCYFENTFTSQPVSLSPPDESQHGAEPTDNYFVGFSFQDVTSTFGDS